MRADRLVAVLLMLQTRGQVTAAQVAAELEVSERTARRDLEALGAAGLPVTSQQGHGGGWRLVGGGRTDLTGLTAGEVQALFTVAGPAGSSGTAATPQVRAALRKLLRALPEPLRGPAVAASTAVLVDPAGWGGAAPPARPPHLDALQRAVIDGQQVHLDYVSRGSASHRTVSPLGLVDKRGTWYLVAWTADGRRTFRVDRVTAVDPAGLPAVRPDGFDLSATWQRVTDALTEPTPVRAAGWADPTALPVLRRVLGARLLVAGPQVGTSDNAGVDLTEAHTAGLDAGRSDRAADPPRVRVELRGRSVRALAGEVAGLGALLAVTDPLSCGEALARIGGELVGQYTSAAAAARAAG